MSSTMLLILLLTISTSIALPVVSNYQPSADPNTFHDDCSWIINSLNHFTTPGTFGSGSKYGFFAVPEPFVHGSCYLDVALMLGQEDVSSWADITRNLEDMNDECLRNGRQSDRKQIGQQNRIYLSIEMLEPSTQPQYSPYVVPVGTS